MVVLGLVLSLLVGVSIGVLGGGGSILTVPLLVYVFGLEPKPAIASSLLVVGVASFGALVQHWRAGNLQLRTGAFFGTAGMVGAYTGGRVAVWMDGGLLLLLFAVMMLGTAWAMWAGRTAGSRAAGRQRAPTRLLAQGFGVGLVAGLVGAGGGFLIVPALTLWAGLPVPSAIATSLFVIVLQSLAASAGYPTHVGIEAGLVAAVGATAMVGALGGSLLSRRLDAALLRRVFAVFVGAMATLILVRETDRWVPTAWAALPHSWPQLTFALLVLAMGVAAGRATQRSGPVRQEDPVFSHGEGI